MATNILYLEGDHLQAEMFAQTLQKFGNVTCLPTEFGFRQHIDSLVARPQQWPSLVVAEMLTRWKDPYPEVHAPPIIREGGFLNAGFRCYEYMRNAEASLQRETTPFLFYTMFDDKDYQCAVTEFQNGVDKFAKKGMVIDDTCTHLRKSSDTKPLEEAVARLLRQP